jgi:SAM-dependent methyltransferase
VLSQFGHIFAPRPDVVIAEMRRVLTPTGRIAFATWPPEHLMGRMFALVAGNSPLPPTGAAPTEQWGDPAIIADRLGARFDAPRFERGIMAVPSLSIDHYRLLIESTVGPMQTLVDRLSVNPKKLRAIRADYEALISHHYAGNVVRHDYLLTRAQAC